ncbi:Uncharacterized membrane protein [Lutibacter oricola]|uniref:Uncharacterized membrane protein n=1 Tax=Lutibacter oricola TaxID=762486 RepID=A0A1H2TKC2_9FLAO|nr:DUF2061 domain-containing protein [Lutibacter oricola]SDW43689.1 Uncharacterized membrane protein [Lutibacter oricola]
MILDQILIPNKSKDEVSAKSAKTSEKPIRSAVKAISWRIIGTLDTMIISYFITGELTMAISIGSIEVVTKMLLYYGHERIWNLIKWRK